MRPNYSLEYKELIDSDKYKLFKNCFRQYYNSNIGLPGLRCHDIDLLSPLFDFSEKELHLCNSLYRNEKKKHKRINERISYLLNNYDCSFLTIQFNNDYVQKEYKKLKQLVIDFLNDLGCCYVANVDFGEKHQRIHFHAVASINYLDNCKRRFGYVYCLPIHKKNSMALSKYIAKFTNHASKETTKHYRVIYSKLKEN